MRHNLPWRIMLRRHLGGDEKFFALYAGIFNRAAHSSLIAITFSCVDVAITNLQRLANNAVSLIVSMVPSAEAEVGDIEHCSHL